MGKKRGPGKGSSALPGSHSQLTLRQEASGIKQNKGGSKNSKAALKLEHLQKLAVWSSGEASVPSLGAFFGRRLAAVGEAMGIPPDHSMFPCQRCETILQPGHNCTIRIEKNASKAQRRLKKSNISTKNDVVFKCHFCSHRNLKRGTPKGYMKQICPAEAKRSSKSEPMISKLQKGANLEDTGSKNETDKIDVEIATPAIPTEIPVGDSPATPAVKTGLSLLDSKRRRRNRSGSKKPAEPESNPGPTDAENSVSTSNKRRRKSWTSLKEIAESSTHNRSVTNMTVPFRL